MAIIKTSSTVLAISGNVGGANFVNSARSPYIRPARRPTSSRSKSQLIQQRSMTVLTNAWNALTVNQRAAWTTAAKNFPHRNRLGIPTTLNGREFYFFRNLFNLSSLGILYGAIESTPPIMKQSPPITTLVLTNPNNATINLQVIQPAPLGPLPMQFLWVSRTFKTIPPRQWPRWTPFCGYASFIDTFNIRPYLIGTAGLFNRTTNPSVGAPGVGEWIAVRAVGRLTTHLDTVPIVARIQIAF